MYDFLVLQASENQRSTIQIGEAAQLAKLSIDTIRFYERRALLPRAPRTGGQFRLFTADDVQRLIFNLANARSRVRFTRNQAIARSA